MTNPLYVFDLDHTLIGCDCMMEWHQFLVEKNIAASAEFLAEDERLMEQYANGELDMAAYLAFSLSPLKDKSVEAVAKLAQECIKTRILPKQYPQAKTLIDSLKKEGKQMVVISASVTFLVQPIARALGIDVALGIDLKISDDRYTNEIEGVLSYQQGKVTRLQQWMATQDTTFDEIHFYSDSINDLSLLQHADAGYLVNPCAKLVAYKDEPTFTTLRWG